MLRGKHVHAIEVARETLAAADVLDDNSVRGRALNALGTSLMAMGEVEQGAAALREAVELADRFGFPGQQNSAYINLADALHLAGRLREAREVIDEGLARELRPSRVWLLILRAELAIEAGEWDEAATMLDAIGERQIGNTLVNLDLRRAELALGRGQHDLARHWLKEAADINSAMDEPQWTGVLGALTAELERREGDLEAARTAVRLALDRIDTRTDDAARLARVSASGATVEADAAQRARDLGEPEAERAALAAVDAHVDRAGASAANNGPIEVARMLVARAERTRARGEADPSAYADRGAGLERSSSVPTRRRWRGCARPRRTRWPATGPAATVAAGDAHDDREPRSGRVGCAPRSRAWRRGRGCSCRWPRRRSSPSATSRSPRTRSV